MAEKSKILVVGSTGYFGKHIVEASVKLGHATFALVRESTIFHPEKSKVIESFKSYGVTLVYGDIHDHRSLVAAIKHVDVVISAVGLNQIGDQEKLIAAIKEAGNVKRFLPSEFGMDVDRGHMVEPALSLFHLKSKIRRRIEAEQIPYTYIVCNGSAGYFLPTLGQANATAPPRDKVVIWGDGNPKVVLVKEEDIATYTIKAVDDPRTVNKIFYMRPPANVLSFNDIVAIWEKKIGKNLEKIHLPEEHMLKSIKEAPAPTNFILAVAHSALIKGDGANFEIDASLGVEASELYPDVKYTTVDEYLDQFV